MSQSERRNAILDVLCQKRFETVADLAARFGVSTRTIRYDILALSCFYPITTCQRRCDFVVFRRTDNVEKWRVNVYSL